MTRFLILVRHLVSESIYLAVVTRILAFHMVLVCIDLIYRQSPHSRSLDYAYVVTITLFAEYRKTCRIAHGSTSVPLEWRRVRNTISPSSVLVSERDSLG